MLTPSRLEIARKRRGLTLTRLAGLAGLEHPRISLYENGHQEPSEETLLHLAEVLEVAPSSRRARRGPDSRSRGELRR
jgi:transcriptional regulator with XRE-family HTH domain